MSKFVTRFVKAVTLAALLAAPCTVQASQINSPIARRQHPGIGFFKHVHHHHVVASPIVVRWNR